MLTLSPFSRKDRPIRLLCLGAHADDIEIGCGATVLAMIAGPHPPTVHWVVFSAAGERRAEAHASAAAFLAGAAETKVEVLDFRDGYFPSDHAAIKNAFEALKSGPAPDVILTHSLRDSHQDHRIVAELTGNTFRDHLILGYEIPKYDGDLGRANGYVRLTADTARRKAAMIHEHFPSQRGRAWFTPDTFLALARLRGIECNAPEGFAEAFSARKLAIDL